ncbi:MAG: hypothetical protein V4582_16660 [Pseudomonadota bacterium]
MENGLSNIEHFHKCVAVVLNSLYENFPCPIDIDTFYIEGEGRPTSERALVNFDDEQKTWTLNGDNSQSYSIRRLIVIYKNTMYYLRDEGYIRMAEPSHGQDQRGFFECVLTSKGLSALGRIGVKERTNWGTLIHLSIKDGKYKLLQDLAIKVLSSGLT